MPFAHCFYGSKHLPYQEEKDKYRQVDTHKDIYRLDYSYRDQAQKDAQAISMSELSLGPTSGAQQRTGHHSDVRQYRYLWAQVLQ